MRSDSVKNMSAYADQNHAPSLTDVRLEFSVPDSAQLAEEITAGTCVTVPFGKVIHFGLDMWWEWEIRRSMTHPGIKGDSWDRTGQYVGAIPTYPSGVVDAGTLWRDDEPDAQNRTSRQGKD